MGHRILYWDIIKCFAIFLVVWGHCMQNMTMDLSYYTQDIVCECIYSFHMALFMLVSGYFAHSSLSKPIIEVLSKRAMQLLIPSIVWFIIIRGLALTVSFQTLTSNDIIELVFGCFTSFWFLKALFMCYFLTMVGSLIFQKCKMALPVYVLFIIAIGSELNYCSTISMLPFFIGGLIFKRFEKIIYSHTLLLTCFTGTVWLLILLFYNISDYSIYQNPFLHSWHSYFSMFVRITAGLSGSIFFILLIKVIFEQYNTVFVKQAANIGSITLGIYCIQVLPAEIFAKTIARYLACTPRIVYDLFITPFYAITIICFCAVAIPMLKKNKYSRLLLFGEL